jgi:hypothetical protein
MQDNRTTDTMTIEPRARRAADAWMAEFHASPTPGARSAVELTDCECPDDCLRDHENE